MVMIIDGIKNLIKITDQVGTERLVNKIATGEKVVISIRSQNEQQLIHNQQCMLIFDVCRSGNPKYNAVSVIRDLLKANHAPGHWTRKKVEALVNFEASTRY